MRGWFFLVVVGLLLAGVVAAQTSTPGGGGSVGVIGTLLNDSPTPINGFTLFSLQCILSNAPQRLVVCSSSPCTESSVDALCVSSNTLANSKSCAVPSPVSHWGFTIDVVGACCSQDGTCQPSKAGLPWNVGAAPSSVIALSSLPSNWDARSSLMVRRSSTEWVGAAMVNNRLRIEQSLTAGASWGSSFFVSSLIPTSPLLFGVAPGDMVADHPSLAIAPDKSVHLVFMVRDASSGMGTVYYSRCSASSNCGVVSGWQPATALIDPSLDVDPASGKWKYAFGKPKMVVDAQSVHVVFDDTQVESPLRFDGIFYKTCLHSSGCDSFSDFFSAGPSPDILNAVSFGGYPRNPMIAEDASGGIHVSFLDGQGILYTRLLSLSPAEWLDPVVVNDDLPLSAPSLSWGGDSILITSMSGSSIRSFRCASNECLDSSSVPDFVESSVDLRQLSSLSGLSPVIGLLSPSDGSKAAFLSTAIVNNVRQVVGLFWDDDSSFSTGTRVLTSSVADVRLAGVSDVVGLFNISSGSSSMLDLSVVSGANAYWLSSNVLDFSNQSPIISNLIPSPGPWTNVPSPSPSTTAFSKNVSFNVQDGDADDALYASVFLAVSPDGEDYPLVKWANIKTAAGVVSSACASSSNPPFTIPSPCTIALSLFSPQTGLAIPSGEYYVVVKVLDTAGGIDSASSGPIAVKASASNLLVSKPLPNEVWFQKNPSQHVVDFVTKDATFAQSLGLHILAKDNAGNSEDFGVVSVATFNSTASSCIKPSVADYSCDTPIGIPSTLPEGVYDLVLYVKEDGILTANHTVPNMTLDFQAPHTTSFSPSGNVGSFPTAISFTLTDFSGVNAAGNIEVRVNGVLLSGSPSCSPSSGIVPSVNCSVSFDPSIVSLQGSSTPLNVEVSSEDGLGNEGSTSFGFTVGQPAPPGDGPGPPSNGPTGGPTGGPVNIIPSLDDLVTPTDDGGFGINGTGIVIPGQVVDSFNRFSDRVILTASDLVEVTGPSANAIFLGLCTLAGIASDIVFRRIFAKLAGEMQRQRQRVLRMALGLVFFVLPLGVGFSFSLAVGFIFAVLEVVLFIAAAYLFKILQYYDTFGFKPIGPAQ